MVERKEGEEEMGDKYKKREEGRQERETGRTILRSKMYCSIRARP